MIKDHLPTIEKTMSSRAHPSKRDVHPNRSITNPKIREKLLQNGESVISQTGSGIGYWDCSCVLVDKSWHFSVQYIP